MLRDAWISISELEKYHMWAQIVSKGLKISFLTIFSRFFEWSGIFRKNRALSLSSLYQVVTSCQKSEKSLEPFSRKWCEYHRKWPKWPKNLVFHTFWMIQNFLGKTPRWKFLYFGKEPWKKKENKSIEPFSRSFPALAHL